MGMCTAVACGLPSGLVHAGMALSAGVAVNYCGHRRRDVHWRRAACDFHRTPRLHVVTHSIMIVDRRSP